MQKEEELIEAKRELDELHKKIDKIERYYVQKEEREELKKEEIRKEISTNSHDSNKKYIRVIVFLIAILLVVDLLSLIVIYKPDFSSMLKTNPNKSSVNDPTTNPGTNSGPKCEDGTIEGKCSKKQPYFCYQGQLVKKASQCGCSVGYRKDFQDCKAI